ncbi:MAG TPA: polyribonucleotide nucleotidyltransferase, partial [Ignavibacteria bacterium]|nr:polyribonucleotide nucleotidyltransferase [Ignavibacteria bacterium]
MDIIRKEVEIGGKKLTLETGRLAKQADGAVMVRYGDTMVLVTAVASSEAREDIDFFPLSVEYREKAFAAGKFPGGFFKREGRPTEKEVLSSRLIDRPIRPLFPKDFKNETQIMASV